MTRTSETAHRVCVIAILFVMLLAALPQSAHSEGRELNLNAHDLSVNVDTRWAGCAYGGYYPIRIRVVNRGPAANLTFRFDPAQMRGGSLPSVERSIGAEQNATLNFTLSIPMVGPGEHGTLRVFSNRSEIEELRVSVTLPAASRMGEARPSVLVISGSPVDFSALEAAENAVLGAEVEPTTTRGPRGTSMSWTTRQSSINLSGEVASPSMLPDKWLDYTGLDLVVVDLRTLEKIEAEPRRAIIEWVETGGTLVVSNVGEPAEKSDKLKQLLDLESRAAVSAGWEAADMKLRNQPQFRLREYLESSPAEKATAEGWHAPSSDAFARRTLMQGSVFAFKNDASRASPADWYWFLSQLGSQKLDWPSRTGLSPRGTNDDFLNFLIPGVTGIHTTAFLVLMSLFTVIIGPLNYFFVTRRKQQYLLLITIPACALITSLTLFGYSTVAHGFHVKSRARSLTVVDQKNRTSVTNCRIALFAGMAPSRGLQFSEATAVYPLWPYSEGFESGSVDWTQSQALESGWLQSRTQTQFATTTHRMERGRLEVDALSEKSLRVSNGFEWDFETLVVANDKGTLFYMGELPAGAVGELSEPAREDLDKVNELLKRHPLEPPDSLKDRRSNPTDMFDVRWRTESAFRVIADSARGSMEEQIKALTARPLVLKPRSYLAVLKQNPGVQLGVEKSDERAGYHLLIGYY